MIRSGDVYWADLGRPEGSRPAKRRPVLVIQTDTLNESRLATVVVAVITSNTSLATMPGNVFLSATSAGLSRDSVVNVTAVITLNKLDLDEKVGHIADGLLDEVKRGLRRVLDL